MRSEPELAKEAHTKISLTCPNCEKTYRIRKHKIPPGSTAVRCKACGEPVRLELKPDASAGNDPGTESAPVPNPGAIKGVTGIPRCRLDLMTEEKRLRPRRKRIINKPWGF